jgi:hypothetical protein
MNTQNLNHVRCGQFRVSILGTAQHSLRMDSKMMPFTPVTSTLGLSVSSVIGSRSKKQMRRIAARGIVAPMEDAERGGINPEMQKVSDAMRTAMMPSPNRKRTVSVNVFSSFPVPALINGTPINLAPKTRNLFSSEIHCKEKPHGSTSARAALQDCSQISKSKRVLVQPAGSEGDTRKGERN